MDWVNGKIKMSENTALKCIVAVYLFVLSSIIFYGMDIITQFLVNKEVDWTKYISVAMTHAISMAIGGTIGWDYCKAWHEGDTNVK